MRVISYIRLSSETQIDNQSANNQKEVNTLEINKLKESKDISPHTQPEVIDDSGISGLLEFKDRKFGKELLQLKEGDYIFASNIDRLARDNRIFENFIYVPYFGGRCIKLPPILPIEDCKTTPDSLLNMLGDQLSFYIGYKIAEKIPEKKLPYLPSYSLIILPILPLILSLITTNIIGYLPEYEEK